MLFFFRKFVLMDTARQRSGASNPGGEQHCSRSTSYSCKNSSSGGSGRSGIDEPAPEDGKHSTRDKATHQRPPPPLHAERPEVRSHDGAMAVVPPQNDASSERVTRKNRAMPDTRECSVSHRRERTCRTVENAHGPRLRVSHMRKRTCRIVENAHAPRVRVRHMPKWTCMTSVVNGVHASHLICAAASPHAW